MISPIHELPARVSGPYFNPSPLDSFPNVSPPTWPIGVTRRPGFPQRFLPRGPDLPIKTILWATVIPSGVVAIALILISIIGRRATARVQRSSAPTTAWSILSVLLLTAAFAFGSFVALGKWPSLPPKAGEEWLVYIALAAGLLGIALSVTSTRLATRFAAIITATLALGVVLLALANAADMGTSLTRLLWCAGICIYIITLASLTERAARMHDETGKPATGAATLPLTLALAALLSSQAITFSANAKEGMMMAVLGGSLLAIAAAQLVWPWRFYIRGLGPLVAALYAGLWFTTKFYTDDTHWPAAIFGLLAPFPSLAVCLAPRITGPAGLFAKRRLLAAFLLATITAIFGAAAIAAAYSMKPPATPYDTY